MACCAHSGAPPRARPAAPPPERPLSVLVPQAVYHYRQRSDPREYALFRIEHRSVPVVVHPLPVLVLDPAQLALFNAIFAAQCNRTCLRLVFRTERLEYTCAPDGDGTLHIIATAQPEGQLVVTERDVAPLFSSDLACAVLAPVYTYFRTRRGAFLLIDVGVVPCAGHYMPKLIRDDGILDDWLRTWAREKLPIGEAHALLVRQSEDGAATVESVRTQGPPKPVRPYPPDPPPA